VIFIFMVPPRVLGIGLRRIVGARATRGIERPQERLARPPALRDETQVVPAIVRSADAFIACRERA
jgi:hypothetical protein